MKSTNLDRAAVLAIALTIAACGGLPERIDTLEQARSDVRELEREPLAARVASEETAAAREALAAADEAYEEDEELPVIEHHAYVAQRYADIANELVAEASAREDVENAQAERNRLIAEAREREAEQAEREAARAQRELQAQSQALDEQAQRADQQARAAAAAEQRNQELQRELEQLQAESTDRGIVLTLGDVLFDTGQAALKPGAAQTMDRLAQFMRDYPERSVRIEGYTDSVGSETVNQRLSEQRADAVRSALIERGLPSERIATVGYGESLPVASNDTSGGRQLNRRVEIVVSGEDGSFSPDQRDRDASSASR